MKFSYDNKENSTTNEENSIPFLDRRKSLQADCGKCCGLCCVALYFSASEGFPFDKQPGKPCINLQSDFCCSVHKNLWEKGLKGCVAFDCFGAGQKVTQVSFGGQDWQKNPESADRMFTVFLIMRQLHEMLWYLAEALTLPAAFAIHDEIRSILEDTERLTYLNPDILVELDAAGHRAKVNNLLVKTSELVRAETIHEQKDIKRRSKKYRPNADLIGADLRKIDLRGANLRNACLIAANLSGNDLSGTDFIGADFRDANIKGADLTRSIFLTQDQLNTAKGDTATQIPPSLNRPAHWVCNI